MHGSQFTLIRSTLACAAMAVVLGQAAAAQAADAETQSTMTAAIPGGSEGADSPPTTAPVALPTVVGNEATSFSEVFTKGRFSGNFRTIYFSSHNAFFTPGKNQDTISYGGNLAYRTSSYYGFSAGVSGFIQRGINHSDNPAQVDGYLGPNLLGMGEAYLQYDRNGIKVVAGNQQLDVPFASTYDWRMAPQLFQGVSARYGDNDNFLTAFKMIRFKSYIDNSFRKGTTYNVNVDSFSSIGNTETNGFWGVGGAKMLSLDPLSVNLQGWYMTYQDYAKLGYVEGKVSGNAGSLQPFAAVQVFHETGDGRELLGHVNSQVYGLQLGVKRQSLTATLGYDRIVPNHDSYLNGALVTPYAHNVSSGPLFAQPFLSSTQDLGAGNAYAFDVSGSPIAGLVLGARYSFMDLKSSATSVSQNQSEYLGYVIYNLGGKLKGWSIADFLALQSSPARSARFIQNRLTLQYAWGT
ncbi:OprD family outer membrane porin [Cupriavidus sp. D39]|uniref:OprD family outer membrane porin n=1 Tax=Cupriavidus sp. D39 TaxID=2997877 RepID=UPI00226E457B|nr:OprD family outer membrane porin [Cupriavidus sp. D39]MCY0853200.1 OprD family outer membrane porin [Cupriavidus sp. D39]